MQMLFTTGSATSTSYPQLSGPGVKGASTKLLVPWVLDLARRCTDGSRRTLAILHCMCRALADEPMHSNHTNPSPQCHNDPLQAVTAPIPSGDSRGGAGKQSEIRGSEFGPRNTSRCVGFALLCILVMGLTRRKLYSRPLLWQCRAGTG
jgi:hypothetical protein